MSPLSRSLLAAALAAASVIAVALAACARGDAGVEQVRVLQLHAGALVAKHAGAAGSARGSLRQRRAAPRLPPPARVPRVGSLALGAPNAGRLVNGLQLPASGRDWITYDPVFRTTPNRPERRWGTDRLLAYLLDVLRGYRLANPGAPPVVVGDLSRPHGGPFGRKYGGLGHASHQNGLDVDVYYPRLDRRLRAPRKVAQVDRRLAQDLVDRFVAAGAQYAFVGQRVGLRGPRGIVQAIPHHDDHVHVRIANRRR
ncbi:MAG TPA: penicillin-insensitive murein endopeptidase [Solirubrobacteraceae bacterium]|nr:penicillin-insensitive murein endopeptidase [Solirubrobacteraceae bacterium]